MTGTRLRTTTSLVAAAALLLGACGGDDDDTSERFGTSTSEATTTTFPLDTAALAAFDWDAPQPVTVGPGWTLQDCPEDDNRLCLTHEDGQDARIAHFRFAAPPDQDLVKHAERFVTEFRDDREKGCGHGYVLEAEPPTPVELADGLAVRYGFTGGSGGAAGRVSERTIQWAGIRDGQLVLVTLAGYDPGACVSPEGEGTLLDVEQVLPGIEALLVATGFPTG